MPRHGAKRPRSDLEQTQRWLTANPDATRKTPRALRNRKDAADKPPYAILKVIAMMRSWLQNHGAIARSALQPDLPRVRGDRLQLRRSIMNLLTNAVEATPDASAPREIFIRAATSGDGSVLVYQAQRNGIPFHHSMRR